MRKTLLYDIFSLQVDTRFNPFTLLLIIEFPKCIPQLRGNLKCLQEFIFFFGCWPIIKPLPRDSLAKRKNLEDMTCVFSKKNEYVHHLFFYCCVAKVIWNELSNMLGIVVKPDANRLQKCGS
jgi:hypothetical protein